MAGSSQSQSVPQSRRGSTFSECSEICSGSAEMALGYQHLQDSASASADKDVSMLPKTDTPAGHKADGPAGHKADHRPNVNNVDTGTVTTAMSQLSVEAQAAQAADVSLSLESVEFCSRFIFNFTYLNFKSKFYYFEFKIFI